MSWQAAAWAMQKGKDYELEPLSRYVLLILADYADKEGNDIYPSLGTLEADTGLSERTIRRHIKTLIGVGLLDYGDQSVVANHPKIRADQRPKVYRLVFERDSAGAVNFGSFGKLPTANPERKTPRKNNDRTERPAVKPVDNSAPEEPTTGLSVHNDRTHDRTQSPTNHLNQKDKPAAPSADPAPLDLDAVRRLREASRARLAARGFQINAPLTARGTK